MKMFKTLLALTLIIGVFALMGGYGFASNDANAGPRGKAACQTACKVDGKCCCADGACKVDGKCCCAGGACKIDGKCCCADGACKVDGKCCCADGACKADGECCKTGSACKAGGKCCKAGDACKTDGKCCKVGDACKTGGKACADRCGVRGRAHQRHGRGVGQAACPVTGKTEGKCPRVGCGTAPRGLNRGVAKNATMCRVFTEDALYTCAAHPEIVSADADAVCPHDGKSLKKMSRNDVKKLRKADLLGCVSCPVVLPRGEGEAVCSVCGANLVPIEKR